MKWAIATGLTMKSGENWLKIFRHHQLLLRRVINLQGPAPGGKIAGDLWWLTKLRDLLGSFWGLKNGLPHVSRVKLWATQCYSATLLRSHGKNKMDRMRQPFWRLKNRSTMINPWQNLGDWVRFSASKPETPNRLLDMRLTNAHRCHDVFRQPKSFMEDVHFAGTTLMI